VTTTTTIEIEQYYERVRAALSGVPAEVRDDLLEDLPDHLAEVLAEGEGSLRDRLGEPDAYAAELRAAAGVADPAEPGPRRLHAGLERATEALRRFDLQAGRLVGYPRLLDLLRAIRPGWWVLRGWIVAQFISGAHVRSTWSGVVPSMGGSHLIGLGATLAVIAASIWFGQRSLRFADWPRRLTFAASAVIAIWAVFVLADNVGGEKYVYVDTSGAGSSYDGYGNATDMADIYVYDQAGNPVVGARLFDQNGNPIQLGEPTCQNGEVAPGTGPDGAAETWTYPLCPNDPGPFRSGPGPVPSNGAASVTGSPTGSPTGATSPATSSAPPPAATKTTPTPKPSR
jgi:hypothetical protein